MIFDDIIYNSKTGQFFNKSGKEIGWVNGIGYMFITVGKKAIRAHKPCIKKRYNKFAVYATKNKVRKYIGLFSTEEDAIKAYDEYMSI